MTKYSKLAAILGSAPDFNDKLVEGRSLKWHVSSRVMETFAQVEAKLLEVPYVTGVVRGTGPDFVRGMRCVGVPFIRVYVKNM